MATMALTRPATVPSKATPSDEERVFMSPWPMATMPGPSGTKVQTRPIMGATFAMRSV